MLLTSPRGKPVTEVTGPDANTPPRTETPNGVGRRFALGFAFAIVLMLIVSLVALDRAGLSARSAPSGASPVVVVDTAQGLIAAWNTAGVQGVELVDVTRDLGYAISPGAFPLSSGWPVPLRDLRSVFLQGVNRQSVVWVASRTGIVRSVTYVLGPKDLAQKVQAGRDSGWPGISADGSSIAANDNGYLRRIGDRFPSAVGPATVLNVDASYFVNGTAESLVSQLGKSLDSYRFVTLNRSTDATDVPQTARQELDRAAQMLRERRSP